MKTMDYELWTMDDELWTHNYELKWNIPRIIPNMQA